MNIDKVKEEKKNIFYQIKYYYDIVGRKYGYIEIVKIGFFIFFYWKNMEENYFKQLILNYIV